MVDVRAISGPLEPARLVSVADLYGAVDAKYADPTFLEHLFTQNPAGPALHAFAFDDGRPVGHCAVVPMRARLGEQEIRCGKVEAFVVGEAYRGAGAGGGTVAASLRDELYRLADAQEIPLLHAYVHPKVGRVLELSPMRTGDRSFVAVVRSSMLPSRRLRLPGFAVAAAQAAVRTPVALALGSDSGLRRATADDADLLDAPPPPRGRWTVLARDAAEWYLTSPFVRVLELGDRFEARALLQLPGHEGDALRLIGWRARRPTLAPALALVESAISVARRAGAATLRFQPWGSPAGDGPLVRACRLLGLLRRDDLAVLYVRSSSPELVASTAVVPTPMLYLGF